MQDASSPLSTLALDSPFCGDDTWVQIRERVVSKEPHFSQYPEDLTFGPLSGLSLDLTSAMAPNSTISIPIAVKQGPMDSFTPMGSLTEKDLLECSQLFGISMASPSSHRSDSSISSTSQTSEFTRSISPPIPTSRATNSSSSLSVSPGAIHASTLPARLNNASHLNDNSDPYWTARSRETRMSVYSAMRPSNNVSDPSIISMQLVDPDPTEVQPLEDATQPLRIAQSSDPVSEPVRVSYSFNSALVEEFSLQRKDSKKISKKEKDEAKAQKKREKSVLKLQKELAQLEKRRVTSMIPSTESQLGKSPESHSFGSYPSHPVPQSLKITKSPAMLSSSPPRAPVTRSPSNPSVPSTPPMSWRTGSTNLSALENVSSPSFGPAPSGRLAPSPSDPLSSATEPTPKS